MSEQQIVELWRPAELINAILSLLRINNQDEDGDRGVGAGREALLQLEKNLPLRPGECVVSADISEDKRGICVRTDSDIYTIMPRGRTRVKIVHVSHTWIPRNLSEGK